MSFDPKCSWGTQLDKERNPLHREFTLEGRGETEKEAVRERRVTPEGQNKFIGCEIE